MPNAIASTIASALTAKVFLPVLRSPCAVHLPLLVSTPPGVRYSTPEPDPTRLLPTTSKIDRLLSDDTDTDSYGDGQPQDPGETEGVATVGVYGDNHHINTSLGEPGAALQPQDLPTSNDYSSWVHAMQTLPIYFPSTGVCPIDLVATSARSVGTGINDSSGALLAGQSVHLPELLRPLEFGGILPGKAGDPSSVTQPLGSPITCAPTSEDYRWSFEIPTATSSSALENDHWSFVLPPIVDSSTFENDCWSYGPHPDASSLTFHDDRWGFRTPPPDPQPSQLLRDPTVGSTECQHAALRAGIGSRSIRAEASNEPTLKNRHPTVPQAHTWATTPLHTAVIKGHVSEAKQLLELGANPNVAGYKGVTPLHYAAFQGNLELISLLKSHGADIEATADNGQSALYFAVCSRDSLDRQNVLPYAVEDWKDRSSVDVRSTDDVATSTINKLYEEPSTWWVLTEGLNQADAGVTPLMAAAEAGLVGTVTMFLRRGACVDSKDSDSYTALRYAARGNHRDIVRLLLEADPKVQKRNLKHMMKLAARNLIVRSSAEGRQDGSRFERFWSSGHDFISDIVADTMVPMYRERGMLDDVIRLARQKGHAGVAELLEARRNNPAG